MNSLIVDDPKRSVGADVLASSVSSRDVVDGEDFIKQQVAGSPLREGDRV
jgi:hypothetical protein